MVAGIETPFFLSAWDWQEATVMPHFAGKARVGIKSLGCQAGYPQPEQQGLP